MNMWERQGRQFLNLKPGSMSFKKDHGIFEIIYNILHVHVHTLFSEERFMCFIGFPKESTIQKIQNQSFRKLKKNIRSFPENMLIYLLHLDI